VVELFEWPQSEHSAVNRIVAIQRLPGALSAVRLKGMGTDAPHIAAGITSPMMTVAI
jgi:hypothetical protein